MSTFVGNYVTELRDAVIASAASGLHLQVIGKPGTGKTAICHATMEALYGDKFAMTRFNPSTPVEKVEGYLDFAALMKDPPEWRVITEGTPYDAQCMAWLADEVYRPNMAVLDKLLDPLDRWDVDPLHSAFIVGTANFLPKDERAEALLDRFGLTYWLETNGDFSAKDVALACMKAQNQRLLVPGLETQQERDKWSQAITKARVAVLSDRAMEAVANTVQHVEKVAEEGLVDSNGNPVRSFGAINNRRRTYWTHLLGKTSALYYDNNDFADVHPMALKALAFAWTSKSQEEANDWRMLMGNVVDPVQAAIDNALKGAYQVMGQEAQGKNKVQVAFDLAKIVNTTSDNLKQFIDESDPRYRQAVLELQNYIAEYIREAA